MTLTEDQIVRYSRQILLREVGGVGQQRLLGAEVRLHGGGPALETAAAYLAAGGSRVRFRGPAAPGFLFDGDTAEEEPALSRLSPERPSGPAAQTVVVAVGPLPDEAADWRVVLGARGGALTLVQGRCPDCVARAGGGLSAPELEGGTFAGALAALAVQRWVLGLDVEPAVVRFEPDGRTVREALGGCALCRGGG